MKFKFGNTTVTNGERGLSKKKQRQRTNGDSLSATKTELRISVKRSVFSPRVVRAA